MVSLLVRAYSFLPAGIAGKLRVFGQSVGGINEKLFEKIF